MKKIFLKLFRYRLKNFLMKKNKQFYEKNFKKFKKKREKFYSKKLFIYIVTKFIKILFIRKNKILNYFTNKKIDKNFYSKKKK